MAIGPEGIFKRFVSYAFNGLGEKTNKEIGSRTGIDFHNDTKSDGTFSYKPETIDDRDSRGNGSYYKKAVS